MGKQNNEFLREIAAGLDISNTYLENISDSTSGEDVNVVQFSQDLSAGALDYTSTLGTAISQILQIDIHFTAQTTETITMTKIFADTNYNTIILNSDLITIEDQVYNGTPLYEMRNSEFRFQCTNATATSTVYITVVYK